MPARAEDSLDTLVPDNPNQPYDMKELIQNVADEGDFFEIQEEFAKNILTGFIRLEGLDRGRRREPADGAGGLSGYRLVAQGGAVRAVLRCLRDSDPDLRGCARFPARDRQEYGGVIKHGAKLLFAYGEATVPKVTVITRKAYGGAYDVMASKHLRGDFNYAWPTAEIAVMGAQGARRDPVSRPNWAMPRRSPPARRITRTALPTRSWRPRRGSSTR